MRGGLRSTPGSKFPRALQVKWAQRWLHGEDPETIAESHYDASKYGVRSAIKRVLQLDSLHPEWFNGMPLEKAQKVWAQDWMAGESVNSISQRSDVSRPLIAKCIKAEFGIDSVSDATRRRLLRLVCDTSGAPA